MEAKACVLMPVYNAEDTIADVMDSILQQSFKDFKILIVDDGSTDKTPSILAGYNSPNLEIMRFKEKIGIVNALNWSLSEISEQYIIRADARIISVPERFRKLVDFMEENPEIGVCGSRMSETVPAAIDQNILHNFPVTHEEIAARMILHNPLERGSMIIRSSILQEKGFRLSDKFKQMEDYDLWYRMRTETRFANLDEPLVYHKAPKKTGKGDNSYKEYRAEALSFFLDKLLKFGIKPTDRELRIHLDLSDFSKVKKISNSAAYKEWIEKLKERNKEVGFFPESQLNEFLDKKWVELFPHVLKQRTKRIVQYLQAENKTSMQIFIFLILHQLKFLFGKK